MDGTLLVPGGGFHNLDLLALEALGRMGVIRVVATGRSPFSFQRMMGRRLLPVDYLVLSSGAGIMDYATGEYLRSSFMDQASTQYLVDWLTGRGYDFCVQDRIPANHVFSYRYLSGCNPDLERRIELYEGHCSRLPRQEPAGPSTQLVAIFPPGTDEQGIMREFLAELGKGFSVLRTTSPLDGRSLWIEIFPSEISKSSGVKWIAERHGLTSYDTAAVGNDYNDHDLLMWAGSAYVVRDSPEHLRSAFTEVTSVGSGAVAHAARLWLTERGQLSGNDSWPSP
jgi:hydroxymethylpyrimidine pyrophosphatase-like HAD family hydrolase